LPGEYNLKNTHLWRQPALKFQKEGKYTNYDSKTDEAKATQMVGFYDVYKQMMGVQ
jgi:hypothetical protein